MLNQKLNWRHVPSCFKTSGHVKKGNCRYNFQREYQESAEETEDGIILAERNIGSENINNFDPVLLHVVRPNDDVRYLTSSTHEIYYVLKYVVKNHIAALTLSSIQQKSSKKKSNLSVIEMNRSWCTDA